MPKVFSYRSRNLPARAVLVDRSSVYGNPFEIGKDGTREEVIEKYRQWIMRPEQAFLRAQMRRELRDRNLVCWCKPKPCHGDVILEIANG